MTIKTSLFVGALALAVSAPVFAQDAAAGGEKAKQVCAACHGPDGSGVASFPDYPKLAGQHPDYLAKALRDYKSGKRKNAIMGAQAQALSTKDINDLAAYFGSQGTGGLYVKR